MSDFLAVVTFLGVCFNGGIVTAIYFKLGNHAARIEQLEENWNEYCKPLKRA